LARISNDPDNASLAVERVLALKRKDPWADDPWWTYDMSHVRNADALIEEMRRALGEYSK
jgi:hypothetical protein